MVRSHNYCLAFSTFVRENWDEMKRFTAVHRYRRNQEIYSLGDPATALYRIESGRVKVVRLSGEGKEKILNLYHEGDLFGEVCICGVGRRNEQAFALEPLSVVSFDVKGLLKLVRKRTELTLDLLMLFCARLVECQEHIATLAFDGIRQRLAKELLRLGHLPGCQPDGGGVRLAVKLTHEELANLVNTTRETATSIMNQFRREGLLEYSPDKTVIFPERLEAYLQA